MDDITVLVVDDVPEARTLIKKILTAKKIKVIEAEDGKQALEMIDQHSEIDLVMLDIGLPDMDGYEVMAHLAPYKEQRNLKVCFVSGKKAKDGILKAIKMGGDDYLVKPIFPDALLTKVALMLGRDNLTEAGYNRVKCSFRASLLEFPIKPDMHIVEISEMNLLIRSTADFAVGLKIEIKSEKFSKYIKYDGTFSLKVLKTLRETTGKYYARCGFIGLTEEQAREIRALAIRGQFLE